jgi:Helix-turn-helix
MPITPEQRERLDAALNGRRLELGITWRDVASRAGISYEALRKLRLGDGGIRDLTAAKVSRALGWEPASVQAIIDGRAPAVAEQPAGTGRGSEMEPQCEYERRILANPAVADKVKLLMLRGHRKDGHDAWCRPDDEAARPHAVGQLQR